MEVQSYFLKRWVMHDFFLFHFAQMLPLTITRWLWLPKPGAEHCAAHDKFQDVLFPNRFHVHLVQIQRGVADCLSYGHACNLVLGNHQLGMGFASLMSDLQWV